jgi:antitoxin component YwqK of YwqJK toxin-antitoxin module
LAELYGPGKILSIVRYKDGKLNGGCRWYYSDSRGLALQGHFKDGVKAESNSLPNSKYPDEGRKSSC